MQLKIFHNYKLFIPIKQYHQPPSYINITIVAKM